MQEIFYEESVSTHNEKSAKNKYTLFTVFMALSFVSAVLCFLNVMFSPTQDGEGNNFTLAVIINLVIWIVFTVLFIAAGVFFSMKRHAFYLSYDYTFVSGELRICKVIHNRKRKLQYRLSGDRIIKIGRVGSESYKKLKFTPDIKEVILTPNNVAEEDKEFLYFQTQTDAGKRLLILECRIQLITQIVRYMRKNILETEFNK